MSKDVKTALVAATVSIAVFIGGPWGFYLLGNRIIIPFLKGLEGTI